MLRLLVAILVLGAGACDLVFSLDRPPEKADADRDGVPDEDDNCPFTANTTQDANACACRGAEAQHDEDHDSIDDACDNCPHVANQDQLNTDGDQLGDACDVDETLECIRYFDAFVQMPVAAAPPIGTWAIVGDRLVQADSVLTRTLFLFDIAAESPRIDTAFENFGGVATTSAGIYFGIDRVTPTSNPALPLGISTQLAQQEKEMNAVVAASRVVNPTGSDSNPLGVITLAPAVTFVANMRGTLSTSVHEDTLHTTGTIGESSVGTLDVTSGSASGAIGLRSVRMAMAFEYLLVADRVDQLPCP